MTAVIIEALIKWGVTALCGVVAAWLTVANKQMRRKIDDERAKMEALGKGMRALLRAEIVHAHRYYYEEGRPLPLQVRTHLADVYAAYHGLNGNGTATKMWEDIQECEVIA